MYLIKSFTLENSNCTVTFDLFNKDGKAILVESALESNGSRTVRSYDGYEDVSKHLWELAAMCDDYQVTRQIRGLINSLVDEFCDYK